MYFLAMSVCYCAFQARQAPENEYLNISNRPAWELLEALSAMPVGWADDVFPRDERLLLRVSGQAGARERVPEHFQSPGVGASGSFIGHARGLGGRCISSR